MGFHEQRVHKKWVHDKRRPRTWESTTNGSTENGAHEKQGPRKMGVHEKRGPRKTGSTKNGVHEHGGPRNTGSTNNGVHEQGGPTTRLPFNTK